MHMTIYLPISVDGPETVEIVGASEARTGDVLSYECITSDSNPPVDIWWVVDGRAIQVYYIYLSIYLLIKKLCIF